MRIGAVRPGRSRISLHHLRGEEQLLHPLLLATPGQAQDGDMVLNDVGALARLRDDRRLPGLAVQRAGSSPRQTACCTTCALATSDHMFSIIRARHGHEGGGRRESDRYCAERLVDAGVLRTTWTRSGSYMWHGGVASHRLRCARCGRDVLPSIAPNMVFCVDVGVYHEEWGIGFRLEDNCLVTETGCENLSAAIPRTIADIEAEIRRI